MSRIISAIKGMNHATYFGTADTILSIIANVMLVALYLSPVPTFWRMIKKGSTEEFHPYPYMITFANCLMWQIYAILLKKTVPTNPFYGLCLSISNEIGLLLSMIYIGIFWRLTTIRNKVNMYIFALLVYGLLAAIVFIVATMQHKLFGAVCVVSGIITYASPLSIIRNVYNTKSAEYLPFWLCVACFSNGVVWVIYIGVTQAFDIYIAITNGAGVLLGLFQLLIYYKFQYQNSRTVHPFSKVYIDAI